MDTRVALISIIVEKQTSVDELNRLLHDYRDFIICRMGLPYRERNVNIISIMLDAPADKINTLAGKLGRLDGVTAKAVYAGMK